MRHALIMFRNGLIGAVLLSLTMGVYAGEPVVHPLFKIERSKNANIIQYDAHSDSDGKLLAKKPVDGYWIRLAEQGQRKKLSWFQKTFAYGFKTKLAKNRESATLKMAVKIGSPISVIRDEDRYRATLSIDGSSAYLEKIYIKATGTGLGVKVHYIEVFGKDIHNGKDRYEKLVP